MKSKLSKTIKLKFILLVVVISIFTLLPVLCSATQIFKQNDVIDLKVQCIINGTYCSASSFCNTTVQYPNGSLLVNNLGMTNQISFHNYTLPSSTTLGDYLCSTTCCDGGYCGTGTDCDFTITTTGFIVSTSKSITMVIGIAIMFLIGVLLFIFGLYSKETIIKVFVLGLSLLILIFSTGYGINVLSASVGEFSSIMGNLNSFYYLAIALLSVGGAGIVVFLVAISLNSFWKYRGLKD